MPSKPKAKKALAFKITHLTHDLAKKKSYVTVFWTDDSDRRLYLVVPFGTSLEDIQQEATNAVQKHAAEVAGMSVNKPEFS
jgi:hypothetical protein